MECFVTAKMDRLTTEENEIRVASIELKHTGTSTDTKEKLIKEQSENC